MIKDIPEYIVEDIAMAIVREENDEGELVWNVYMINMKPNQIEGVLVTSTGYGNLNGEDVKTSTLRHFLDVIPAHSFAKVEPIMENVFGLNNEFWISFYEKRILYDKRYVFLAESIKEQNFITIPVLNKKGVMIR